MRDRGAGSRRRARRQRELSFDETGAVPRKAPASSLRYRRRPHQLQHRALEPGGLLERRLVRGFLEPHELLRNGVVVPGCLMLQCLHSHAPGPWAEAYGSVVLVHRQAPPCAPACTETDATRSLSGSRGRRLIRGWSCATMATGIPSYEILATARGRTQIRNLKEDLELGGLPTTTEGERLGCASSATGVGT